MCRQVDARKRVPGGTFVYPERAHDGRDRIVDPTWIAVIASTVAALCAAAAWHGGTLLRKDIQVLHTQTDGRWQESMGEHGRAERARGELHGMQSERSDNVARLEEVALKGVLVTELPSEKRRPDAESE